MRENLINLTTKEHKTFKRHFIKNVIIAITLDGLNKDIIFSKEPEIKQTLERINYNEHKRIKRYKIELKEDIPKTPVLVQEGENTGIVYKNKDVKKQIEVNENKLIFSDLNYIGFKEFFTNLKAIIEIIQPVLNYEIKRVGFRKINSLLLDPVESYSDINNLFNPALFGIVKSGLPAEIAITSYEDNLLLEKGDYKCFIKTKFTKKAHPEYELQLDYDIVNDEIKKYEEIFQGPLEKMNQIIYDLFIWSISDDLIKVMSEGEL